MSTFFQLAEVLARERQKVRIELPPSARPRQPESAFLLNPVAHRPHVAPPPTPPAANDNRPPAPPMAQIG